MKTFEDETMEIAITRSEQLQTAFVEEVRRLLKSGALDREHHNRSLLFGVAIENIADNYLRGDRNLREYKNLKCF